MKTKRNILAGITAFVLAFSAAATPLGDFARIPYASTVAYAEDGDYTYATVTADDGTKSATLTGYNGAKDITELTVPKMVDGLPVKEISWYNFNMPDLKTITVPEGVTKISGGGFRNCAALETVSLPKTLEYLGGSFEGCTSLKNINIPENLTYISGFLFSGCSSLVSVDLPDSIIAGGMPNGLFENCTSLSTKFIQSIVDKTPSLGSSVFNGCTSLTEITIPESLGSFSKNAFANCTGLKKVTLLKTKAISWTNFDGCTSLTDITVMNVNQKYESFFGDSKENIKNITVLEVPDNTKIFSNEFKGFTALETVTLPENIVEIEKNAFADTGLLNQTTALKYADKWVIGCDENVEEVVINDGSLGIGAGAFDDAVSLVKITVPGTFKNKTVNDALSGNKTIKTVIIKDGIENIASGAFSSCSSLEEITVPDTVKNIGSNAFYGTKLLADQKDELIKYADKWVIDFEYDIPYKSEVSPYDIVEEAVINDGTPGIASGAFADAYLQTIYIPSSVEYINDGAFTRASVLTDVYYEGSKEMFEKIVIGTGNECLLNAKIHYGAVKPCKVHAFGEWEENVTSCTQDGTKTRKCTVCGKTETETVKATGKHDWQSVGYIWEDDNSACTGKVYCSKGDSSCSIKVKATLKVTAPATCTKAGIGVYTAAGPQNIIDDVVFETQTKTAAIPATGHKYTDKVVAPTTSAQGYTLHTCSVCGDNYKDNYKDKLPAATTKVSAVTGLKLKGRASNALRIGWNKNTSADGYIVEMYKGGKWVRVSKISKNTTVEWKQTGLAAGTAYKFRVKAYKMSGKTAVYSSYVNISARTNPSNVTGMKTLGKAKNAVRFGWTKNTSADGYIVEMYSGGKWVRAAKITKNSTVQYKKTGLKAGTTYKFRIRAYKMSGSTALYSGYTNYNIATTK